MDVSTSLSPRVCRLHESFPFKLYSRFSFNAFFVTKKPLPTLSSPKETHNIQTVLRHYIFFFSIFLTQNAFAGTSQTQPQECRAFSCFSRTFNIQTPDQYSFKYSMRLFRLRALDKTLLIIYIYTFMMSNYLRCRRIKIWSRNEFNRSHSCAAVNILTNILGDINVAKRKHFLA